MMPLVINLAFDTTSPISSTNLRMTEKPEKDFSVLDKMMLTQEVRTYGSNMEKNKRHMGEAYSILMEQCDDDTTQQLATCAEWPGIEDRCDPIDLLKLFQRIYYDFKQEPFPVMAELKALQKLFRMKQDKDESLTDVPTSWRWLTLVVLSSLALVSAAMLQIERRS